jgi:hypothetical protein
MNVAPGSGHGVLVLAAAVTIVLLLGGGATALGSPTMLVVHHEPEAPALANFLVRLRITNDGAEDVVECDRSVIERPPQTPCVAVGFRSKRRPPRVSFSRLDRASLGPGATPLAPGATTETTILIPTPGRAQDIAFYFYLVTAGHGTVSWTEQVLHVKIGDPPPGTMRNIRRTQLLLGTYILGTTAAVMVVLARRRTAKSR